MAANKKFVVVRSIAIAILLSYLGGLAMDLGVEACPDYSKLIRRVVGTLLAIAIGIVCLRPVALAYMPKGGFRR